jgi:hypothetical protein
VVREDHVANHLDLLVPPDGGVDRGLFVFWHRSAGSQAASAAVFHGYLVDDVRRVFREALVRQWNGKHVL